MEAAAHAVYDSVQNYALWSCYVSPPLPLLPRARTHTHTHTHTHTRIHTQGCSSKGEHGTRLGHVPLFSVYYKCRAHVVFACLACFVVCDARLEIFFLCLCKAATLNTRP